MGTFGTLRNRLNPLGALGEKLGNALGIVGPLGLLETLANSLQPWALGNRWAPLGHCEPLGIFVHESSERLCLDTNFIRDQPLE